MSSQKARVAQSAETYKKQGKIIDNGFQIDPNAPAFQQRKGKWISSDQDFDNEIKLRQEYTTARANNTFDLGELTVDDKFLEKVAKKKEDEQYLQEVKVGNYLIDPKIPESQERVFHILPELKEVPDKQFLQNIAQQEALRLMLRDGVVRGREDHQLILQMMRYDYALPVHALWDENDNLTSATFRALPLANIPTLPPGRDAIYDPMKYVIDIPANGSPMQAYLNALVHTKKLILRRLYPGLEAMYQSDVDGNGVSQTFNTFYENNFRVRTSNIDGAAVTNNYFNWW